MNWFPHYFLLMFSLTWAIPVQAANVDEYNGLLDRDAKPRAIISTAYGTFVAGRSEGPSSGGCQWIIRGALTDQSSWSESDRFQIDTLRCSGPQALAATHDGKKLFAVGYGHVSRSQSVVKSFAYCVLRSSLDQGRTWKSESFPQSMSEDHNCIPWAMQTTEDGDLYILGDTIQQFADASAATDLGYWIKHWDQKLQMWSTQQIAGFQFGQKIPKVFLVDKDKTIWIAGEKNSKTWGVWRSVDQGKIFEEVDTFFPSQTVFSHVTSGVFDPHTNSIILAGYLNDTFGKTKWIVRKASITQPKKWANLESWDAQPNHRDMAFAYTIPQSITVSQTGDIFVAGFLSVVKGYSSGRYPVVRKGAKMSGGWNFKNLSYPTSAVPGPWKSASGISADSDGSIFVVGQQTKSDNKVGWYVEKL